MDECVRCSIGIHGVLVLAWCRLLVRAGHDWVCAEECRSVGGGKHGNSIRGPQCRCRSPSSGWIQYHVYRAAAAMQPQLHRGWDTLAHTISGHHGQCHHHRNVDTGHWGRMSPVMIVQCPLSRELVTNYLVSNESAPASN